jgi:shikimate dehydrogenase
MNELKLALIGVGISRSRAPELHRLAGRLLGIAVTYDLIPLESDAPPAFEEALMHCRSRDYRGVNVTHPFKECAAVLTEVSSDEIRRLGAVNTVLFEASARPKGFNTDYTGFIRAFQGRFPRQAPGSVAIVGAGGVGRAIAFAFARLQATELRLFDQDFARCERLAEALGSHGAVSVRVCKNLEEAVAQADGLVNATPIGMHQYPGTPIPRTLVGAQRWVFDAVYTPVDTCFLQDARAAAVPVLEGYELFFHQGVEAFERFSGMSVDETKLRSLLEP